MLDQIYKKIAEELNLDIEVVKAAYQSQWLFIREKIEELPINIEMSEEEFNSLRVSFNIPSLGKMFTSFDKIQKNKRRIEYLKQILGNAKD